MLCFTTNRQLLRTVRIMRFEIMASIDKLRQEIQQFVQETKAREASFQSRLDAAVQKALEDDEVKDSAALQELIDEINAMRQELPPVEFEPSNQ